MTKRHAQHGKGREREHPARRAIRAVLANEKHREVLTECMGPEFTGLFLKAATHYEADSICSSAPKVLSKKGEAYAQKNTARCQFASEPQRDEEADAVQRMTLIVLNLACGVTPDVRSMNGPRWYIGNPEPTAKRAKPGGLAGNAGCDVRSVWRDLAVLRTANLGPTVHQPPRTADTKKSRKGHPYAVIQWTEGSVPAHFGQALVAWAKRYAKTKQAELTHAERPNAPACAPRARSKDGDAFAAQLLAGIDAAPS